MILKANCCGADVTYRVSIRRMGLVSLFDIQGKLGDVTAWAGNSLPPFPDLANTGTQAGERELYWVGRHRWMLRGPISQENAINQALLPESAPSGVSIVIVSDAHAFFKISGPDADQVLAVATSLDFFEMPANGAGFTEVFGQRALIVKRRQGYELAFDSSYAAMMEDFLARASGTRC